MAITESSINTIFDNAKQSAELGLIKLNPYTKGTLEYNAYESGWNFNQKQLKE
jgi:hypothetical protein